VLVGQDGSRPIPLDDHHCELFDAFPAVLPSSATATSSTFRRANLCPAYLLSLSALWVPGPLAVAAVEERPPEGAEHA
jgi:hypothetical protein